MITTNKYRQHYHLTPPPGFMNDIQSFFHDGEKWHIYYLWNGQYPEPAGSEWRHVTTVDWKTYEDQGVAIPKQVAGLPDKDVATGTIIVDKTNIAGFGHGTLLAYATTFFAGRQRTNLWYSTDHGASFKPYAGNPVQANELALADFRDPYAFIHEGKIYIYMAEKFKIGIYESDDGRQFRYVGEVSADDVDHMGDGNAIECPCLLKAMDVDGSPAQQKAVLLFSGKRDSDNSLGSYYMVGRMEGPLFKTETAPKRLDFGPDFYAPRAQLRFGDESSESAYVLGWMSSWDYTTNVPGDGTYGSMSMCRNLTLSSRRGYTLISRPMMFEQDFRWREASEWFVAANQPRQLAIQPGQAFALSLTFPITKQGRYGFTLKGADWSLALRYDAATQRCHIDRQCSEMGQATIADELVQRAFNSKSETELNPYTTDDGEFIRVSVFIDTTSAEFFFHDGQACTMSKFGREGNEVLTLYGSTDMSVNYRRRHLL